MVAFRFSRRWSLCLVTAGLCLIPFGLNLLHVNASADEVSEKKASN